MFECYYNIYITKEKHWGYMGTITYVILRLLQYTILLYIGNILYINIPVIEYQVYYIICNCFANNYNINIVNTNKVHRKRKLYIELYILSLIHTIIYARVVHYYMILAKKLFHILFSVIKIIHLIYIYYVYYVYCIPYVPCI